MQDMAAREADPAFRPTDNLYYFHLDYDLRLLNLKDVFWNGGYNRDR